MDNPTSLSELRRGHAEAQRAAAGAQVTIQFPNATPDLGNIYAEELQEELRDVLAAGDRIERRRTDPQSQDFGATLVLVLGTTAVTAIAEGIRTWLARNSGASVDIVVGTTTVHGRNLDSQGVQELAKALAAAAGA